MFCNRPGVIAVCIDDGHDTKLDYVLDQLKVAQIPATFFQVGRHLANSEARKAFARRALLQGHSIQHHTWDHADVSEEAPEVLEQNLDKTSALYKNMSGIDMKYFRPPQGRYGANLLRALAERNMTNVMWSYSLSDYGKANHSTIWAGFMYAMNTFKPQKHGLVTVQHFVNTSGQTSSDLIPRMAEEARLRGWRFVTLDDCLGFEK